MKTLFASLLAIGTLVAAPAFAGYGDQTDMNSFPFSSQAVSSAASAKSNVASSAQDTTWIQQSGPESRYDQFGLRDDEASSKR